MGAMKQIALELQEMTSVQLLNRLTELEGKEDSIHESAYIKSILLLKGEGKAVGLVRLELEDIEDVEKIIEAAKNSTNENYAYKGKTFKEVVQLLFEYGLACVVEDVWEA